MHSTFCRGSSHFALYWQSRCFVEAFSASPLTLLLLDVPFIRVCVGQVIFWLAWQRSQNLEFLHFCSQGLGRSFLHSSHFICHRETSQLNPRGRTKTDPNHPKTHRAGMSSRLNTCTPWHTPWPHAHIELRTESLSLVHSIGIRGLQLLRSFRWSQ